MGQSVSKIELEDNIIVYFEDGSYIGPFHINDSIGNGNVCETIYDTIERFIIYTSNGEVIGPIQKSDPETYFKSVLIDNENNLTCTLHDDSTLGPFKIIKN